MILPEFRAVAKFARRSRAFSQESCATVSYTVEHVKDQVVEFLKSNPLESVQARIVRTLQTWLAAHTEARAAQSRTPRRSTGSISDDQVDEDDVVTVTKIQFLEQQLAELRALMMQPGAMPAPPPPQPVRSSADVEVHVFASAPQEPVVIVAKPQSYPVSEPATIRVDTGAAPEPLRASASETCAFVSPPASVSTRPAAPATPARPNMVSLVAQASAVKLKAAATSVPSPVIIRSS